MHSNLAQSTQFTGRADEPASLSGSRPERLKARFLSIVGLWGRVDDVIGVRYAGCGWNDAIEQQMIDDAARVRYGA
jgi:hypothetical protein